MFIKKRILTSYKDMIKSLTEESADLKAENYRLQVEIENLKQKKSATRKKAK